ncbi:MAG: hypothetical protein K9L31_01740 [Candidatus Pacebacteria bacterium]|nr:hypothetical protein [Candidatus Paceibacterota bacterium]
MSAEEHTYTGGTINGRHCLVLNPKHPTWTAERDARYRENFFRDPRSDVVQLGHRCKGNLGRHNGRDIKRSSLPDAMSLSVTISPEDALVAYAFSKFWVGRVL